MSNEVQVCLNGHVISETIVLNSGTGQVTCPKCGSKTLEACVECKGPINARYVISPIAGAFNEWVVPSSCEKCGKSFPWTESRLRALDELADELEGLTKEERKILKKSSRELVNGGPQAGAAAVELKKIFKKLDLIASSKLYKDLLIDILSEAAKKSLDIS